MDPPPAAHHDRPSHAHRIHPHSLLLITYPSSGKLEDSGASHYELTVLPHMSSIFVLHPILSFRFTGVLEPRKLMLMKDDVDLVLCSEDGGTSDSVTIGLTQADLEKYPVKSVKTCVCVNVYIIFLLWW